MATLRLFIAAPLPEGVRKVMSAVQRELAEAGAPVKWSRVENLHLTLKFLGDTPEEEVPKLSAALDGAAAASQPHEARLGVVGAFPNVRRPRVLWVGLEEPTGELVALQQRVEQVTRYLVEPDPRGFSAHLTLGRVKGRKNLRRLSELVEGYHLDSAETISVRSVELIRSQLGRGGPTYTTLHRSTLGA